MQQRPQIVLIHHHRAANAFREVVSVALPKPDFTALSAGNQPVFGLHPVNLVGGFVQLLGNRFTTGRTVAQQSCTAPR